MSDFYNEKSVKTRKEHECLACGTHIRKGLQAYYNDGIFDGDFYSYYICEFCKKIFEIDKNIDYDAGIADSTKDSVEYSLGIWIDNIDLENRKVTYNGIIEPFEDFYLRYNLEKEEAKNE